MLCYLIHYWILIIILISILDFGFYGYDFWWMFKFSFAILAIIVKFNCIRYVAAAKYKCKRGTKIAINNGSNERNKILRVGVKNEIYSLAFSQKWSVCLRQTYNNNHHQGHVRTKPFLQWTLWTLGLVFSRKHKLKLKPILNTTTNDCTTTFFCSFFTENCNLRVGHKSSP